MLQVWINMDETYKETRLMLGILCYPAYERNHL